MVRSFSVVALGVAFLLLTVSSVLADEKKPGKEPKTSAANDPFAASAHENKPPPSAAKEPRLRVGEAAIEEALAKPTQLEFQDTPLSDVIAWLKEYHGIEIQLDTRALSDVGIGTDTPITKNLKGISLRSALNLMLKELNLAWTIEDEVLLITTPEEAESRLTTKVYDVADLVACRNSKDNPWDDYDTLIHMITTTIKPTSWDAEGGPGSIVGESLSSAKVLVVCQTRDIHQRIAELFARIREIAKKNPNAESPRRDKPRASAARIEIGVHQKIAKLLAYVRAIAKEFPEKEQSSTPKPSKDSKRGRS